MAEGRNTTRRDKFRKIVATDEPPCHLQSIGKCFYPGEPIDYEAHHLDPRSFTIDHIVPIWAGGSDTLDNIGAAHRKCNRDKSNKPMTAAGITFVTERTW